MSKPTDKKHSFQNLLEASLPREDLNLEGLGDEAYRALLSDAFKNGVVQEPIYGVDEYIAYECLSRPACNDMKFRMDILSEQFYARGVAEEFDILTTANGLKAARNFPVTLNIAVDTVLSTSFWEKMEKRLSPFAPQDLIFEILEHDVDLDADISHLERLRAQGYRFALDDFAIGDSHKNRLFVFGGLIDYIKIDGPLVRAGLGDESDGFTQDDFDKLLDKIKGTHPEATLIAERVRSRAEADTLFDLGFKGVQGRQLKAIDFPYSIAAQNLAKLNMPCDYN